MGPGALAQVLRHVPRGEHPDLIVGLSAADDAAVYRVSDGHTVVDAEAKYGLCVTGRADPDHLLTKGGALPEDALLLTKPLGTGLITTALKRDQVRVEDLEAAVHSMLLPNQAASRAAVAVG